MFQILASFHPKFQRRRPHVVSVLDGAPGPPGYVTTVTVTDTPLAVARTQVRIPDGPSDEGRLNDSTRLLVRSFGPEGLKHFFSMLIALDEGRHQGWYAFDANEHLDRLGYRRRQEGAGLYHHSGNVRKARRIVGVLSSVRAELTYNPTTGTLTTSIRLFAATTDDQAAGTQAIRWESTSPTPLERVLSPVQDGELIIANPEWYAGVAQTGGRKTGKRYTRQLRRLATEDARENGIALRLGAYLPIRHRLNGPGPGCLKWATLMRWAGLNPEGRHASNDLKELRAELDYMTDQGYIGGWQETGRGDGLDEVVELTAPDWLRASLSSIRRRR